MTEQDIIRKIEEERLIMILRGYTGERLLALAEAFYQGGIRLLEITYNAEGNPADEEIAANIAALTERFAGKMLIGAGTVLTKKQVELTRGAGGCFIISPDADPEVIGYTKQQGLVSIPGALTPTEIKAAARAGADFIKLFPASLFGPAYVKTVKAPLSHVRMLAVGGIRLENIAEYRTAGASGFGVGTSLVDKALIEKGDYDAIAAETAKYVRVAKESV